MLGRDIADRLRCGEVVVGTSIMGDCTYLPSVLAQIGLDFVFLVLHQNPWAQVGLIAPPPVPQSLGEPPGRFGWGVLVQ